MQIHNNEFQIQVLIAEGSAERSTIISLPRSLLWLLQVLYVKLLHLY